MSTAANQPHRFTDDQLLMLIRRAFTCDKPTQIHPYASVVGGKLVVAQVKRDVCNRLRQLVATDFAKAQIKFEYLVRPRGRCRRNRDLVVSNKCLLATQMAKDVGLRIKTFLDESFLHESIRPFFNNKFEFYPGGRRFRVNDKNSRSDSAWHPDAQINFCHPRIPAIVIDVQIGGNAGDAMRRAFDFLERSSGHVRVVFSLHVQLQEEETVSQEATSPRIPSLSNFGLTNLREGDEVWFSAYRLWISPETKIAYADLDMPYEQIYPERSPSYVVLDWHDLSSQSWDKVVTEKAHLWANLEDEKKKQLCLDPPSACFDISELTRCIENAVQTLNEEEEE